MKVADYVAEFIASQGVRHLFLISGGGIMHLLDSVSKQKDVELICNFNEQASSICADSYGQYTNKLGVCLVTTGPGGTNAVTGIAASFLDSTPVLAISGQCKTADFARLRHVRQFGAQEVDIVSIVRPITKYAVTITHASEIAYHLEKAVYLAQEGRKGPVWLDIPLDIQAAEIDPAQLQHFDPAQEGIGQPKPILEEPVQRIYDYLNQSQRPCLLVGGGAAGAQKDFRALAERLQIPVLTSWRAKDFMPQEHELYFGAPGIPAPRYANYVLQNCDLLVIIGCRLNPALTAYDEEHFACQAQKIIIDMDPFEIEKLDMAFAEKIVADAGEVIREMIRQSAADQQPDRTQWLRFCRQMKQKYPLLAEQQPLDQENRTDGYVFAHKLSALCQEDDVLIGSSSGRTCGISHMALEIKEGQRFISSMGLGSMGFVIPSAIACCLASGKKRTIALEGDGSLQHNIQELQLIQNYQLPIKLFIFSNSGYASIYMMQHHNFSDNFAACHPETGVSFPTIQDIAKTYQLNYYRIDNNDMIDQVLAQVMADSTPVLCEVIGSIHFDEIPKSLTIAHKDGTFTSSSLENLYPFLSAEELLENMPDWK